MHEYTEAETVDWLKTLEKRMSSAAVALFTDDDHVLVVKAWYKKYWSFPGGVVDPGETPRQAAVRETHEEVGLAADGEALEFRFVVDRVSPIAQTYQFIFQQRVGDSFFEHVQIDGDEIEAFEIVTRQQILDNDRYYGQSTRKWAEEYVGYHEQQFGAGRQAEI